MANSTYISKVALVGAGGNSGRFISEALLKTGMHTVTALTRVDSQSQLPEGIITKKVDYSKPETLVEALTGQDALVITLSGAAGKGVEVQLIKAAGEAGVAWILPSDFCPDTQNEALVRDVFVFQARVAIREAIADLNKSSYISVCTGFWYEYTLAMPGAFGIDFAHHTALFFDEGETKISTTTLPQVGRAVAALLSLPITPEDSNKKGCLENFKNMVVYVNSFTVSQKDMLESALRVTGTREDNWTITKETAQERHTSGVKGIQGGNPKRIDFAKMMYTRVFYPDGCGDFESKGTLNGLLGLPKEDIDNATRDAFERSKTSDWIKEG